MQPLDEAAHLLLGVRVQHDERILDAPVGGVGDVRHAREAVERDVVRGACAREPAHARACAAARFARTHAAKRSTAARARRQAVDLRVATSHCARTVGSRRARRRPRTDRAASRSPRAGGAAPRPAAARRFGFSSRSSCRYGLRSTTQMSPSTSNSMRAERPVRRSARSSEERLPRIRAEQADDDLAIGERRVVVGNLAQARVRPFEARFGRAGGFRRLHQHAIDSTTALQQAIRPRTPSRPHRPL